MPHTEAKLVDTENGKTVEMGETGEMCIRGPCVFKGYFNEPEKTAEVVDGDRWYHTGDLASMDESGYVKIVGRAKDMIIRGGENIYPAEVESFLLKHPSVADAQGTQLSFEELL
jgi:fatty-acyl-CoA synthase